MTWQCEWQSWRSWHFQEAGRFLLPTLILSWSFRGLSWPQGCSLQLRELRRTEWDNIRNVFIRQLLRKSWHRDLSRILSDVTTLYNIPDDAWRKLERGAEENDDEGQEGKRLICTDHNIYSTFIFTFLVGLDILGLGHSMTWPGCSFSRCERERNPRPRHHKNPVKLF